MKRFFLAGVAAALVPVGAVAGAATDVTPDYYVNDSLVALYDGVFNAVDPDGTRRHDAAATTWADLSGNGRDFTLEAGGSWEDESFRFDALSATLSPSLPWYRTQEIRFNMESGRWVLFGSLGLDKTAYQGLVTVSGTLKQYQTSFTSPASNKPWLNANAFTLPFTATTVYGEDPSVGSLANYCNGAVTPAYTGNNTWLPQSDTSAIGAWPASGKSNWNGKGTIQSIRLYSRALTEEEIARNVLVDRVRFDGAALPEALEPTVECAQAPSGDVGDAIVRWGATSLGWLADELSSATVELSETADFAAPLSQTADPGSKSYGYASFTDLKPGATYYVRATVVNEFGKAATSAVATVVALAEANELPLAGITAAAATSLCDASLAVSVDYVPAGPAIDLYAVLSASGVQTVTNVLATGLTATGDNSYVLSYLQPGTAYTATLLVVRGGETAVADAKTFSTPAPDIPLTAYAHDGIILWLDGLSNALDAEGKPTHAASPATWTDLTGNMTFSVDGSGAAPVFGDTAVVLPAAEKYFHTTDAQRLMNNVLGGTFTIESSLKLAKDATTEQHCYAAYSLGSGSSGSPRTICFDFRYQSGQRGCIQFNANGWSGDGGRLNAYDGNSSTIPATYAVVGGGEVGADPSVYHAGTFLQTVTNYGYLKPDTSRNTLNIRHYGSTCIETTYYAFRAYDRALSADELARNAALDEVRLFGAAPPEPVAPVFSVSVVDNGVAGEASVAWVVDSIGWLGDAATLTMEYSASPDFADATEVVLATATAAASGTVTLENLVPGGRYYLRAKVVNALGLASVAQPAPFRASEGATANPTLTAGAVSAQAGAATVSVEIVRDGGAACDVYAVLQHGGAVETNLVASGLATGDSAALALSPLLPGTAYTVKLFARNALDGLSDEAVRNFTTAAETVIPNPYVAQGLIGWFDAIWNSLDDNGKPVHKTSPETWTDLLGNFPTTTSGERYFESDQVNFYAPAYTQCDDAGRAAAAILSGNFTVETTMRFPEQPTLSWPIYSFGSGYHAAPRLLCFDARESNGLQGSVQLNASKWYDDTMMLHGLDFSTDTTWTVVGGGSPGADAALYANAIWTNAVLNHGDYAPGYTGGNVFAIHRYTDQSRQGLYRSFRIYDRSLTPEEVAANRFAEEIRYFGREASLAIASASRAGNALSVDLSRVGATHGADIYALFSATYGDEGAETATGYRFEEGGASATLYVAVPAGANYVRFKSGGLVTGVYLISDAVAAADDLAVGLPTVAAASATSAAVSALVTVPAAATEAAALRVRYGLAPDELSLTATLAGAATASESDLVEGVLSGLCPGRTYYLSLVATCGEDEAASEVVSFTTPRDDSIPSDALLGGDVAVTGQETGDTLTFSGTSQGAAGVAVNGVAAAIAADGSWSVTFTDVAPGVASDYLVRARAADGTLDALPVFSVTTRGASGLSWNVAATAVQRALSVTGSLAPLGANETTVRLLVGSAPDALEAVDSRVIAADGNPSFAFSWRSETFADIYWSVEIENAASDPAHGRWTSATAPALVQLTDSAIYTWRDVDGDWTGAWDDPAHWADDKSGDTVG